MGEYKSATANEPIAPMIGCAPLGLNEWVKRAEVDADARKGVTSN